MANCITRSIPNTLTCLNLFSGCIACIMAFEANYNLALLFIILSAVFDFFDGMMARLLDAHSPIGKDLDSLADDVSFGVAPSLVVFSLFKRCIIRHLWSSWLLICPMPHSSFPYSRHCVWQSSITTPARQALSLEFRFLPMLFFGHHWLPGCTLCLYPTVSILFTC
mgnify:CR=1 FL=1